MNRLKPFLRCDKGVAALEYAFIASLIAVVIVGVVTIFGQKVHTLYQDLATKLP